MSDLKLSAVDQQQIVELRGIEKLFSNDSSTITIAHKINVSGDIRALVARAEASWGTVINSHPNMRAVITKPEFIRIDREVSETDVSRMIEIIDMDGEGVDFEYQDSNCFEIIERRCNETRKPSFYPSFLSIYTWMRSNCATVVLYTDHCISDGFSGLVILNDFLNLVMNPDLKLAKRELQKRVLELFAPKLTPLEKIMVNVAGFVVLQEAKSFKSVFPLASRISGIKNNRLPRNDNHGCFANGNPVRMKEMSEACKRNGVTVHGALCVAVGIAIARASKAWKNHNRKPFKLALELDYNMRNRINPPLGKDYVGYFVGIAPIEEFKTKGVNPKRNFWEAARRAKKVTDSTVHKSMFKVTMAYPDLKMDSEEKTAKQFRDVKGCVFTDINISNIGKYPFPLLHASPDGASEIKIDSFHLYNNLPNFTANMTLFVAATDRLFYSFSHKMEDDLAKEVFNSIVNAIEGIGSVKVEETVGDYANRLTV